MSALATATLSVAEYSAQIGRALRAVGGACVEGEVQKPRTAARGGLYFDLGDGSATLSCKVFASDVRRLEHEPRHGDLVQVEVDRPDLWARAGKLDLVVSQVRLAGEGELLRRREELLRRLEAEGLCDPSRWRAPPRFPRAVGVIAARGSDGLADVVRALRDRFPPVHVVTCAATVQGVRAPMDVVDALARLDAHPLVDVIVVARGGGLVQDLVAFDDERLCRAVSACPTPVIAAIGHTDNVPVCNHVTWSSETPSRSAERAVPSAASLRQDLELAAARLAPAALGARRLELTHAAVAMQSAEHTFFARRAEGLACARETLAGVPRRVPDPGVVFAAAGRLDARAAAFFSERAEKVRDSAAGLTGLAFALADRAEAAGRLTPGVDAALASLEKRRSRADDQGGRLVRGIRKELADHLNDYGRALTRHVDATRGAAGRRLDREHEQLGDVGRRGTEACRRRVVGAQRDLAHAAAVLIASDPRRRGWVLPTGPGGAVVRSVRELTPGDRLGLSFHDGAAGAVVDEIPPKEDP